MITFPWFAPVMWAIFLIVVVWSLSVLGPLVFGAPWVPMPVAKARRMLQLAGLQPGETVYDLGSGDGRVLMVAAREFGANAIGVEIDPLRTFFSRLLLRQRGLQGRARVLRANLFNVNLAEADVITLYLLPRTHARLAPKLQRELKPGARVVTLQFPLPGWEPVVTDGGIQVYRK